MYQSVVQNAQNITIYAKIASKTKHIRSNYKNVHNDNVTNMSIASVNKMFRIPFYTYFVCTDVLLILIR